MCQYRDSTVIIRIHKKLKVHDMLAGRNHMLSPPPPCRSTHSLPINLPSFLSPTSLRKRLAPLWEAVSCLQQQKERFPQSGCLLDTVFCFFTIAGTQGAAQKAFVLAQLLQKCRHTRWHKLKGRRGARSPYFFYPNALTDCSFRKSCISLHECTRASN